MYIAGRVFLWVMMFVSCWKVGIAQKKHSLAAGYYVQVSKKDNRYLQLSDGSLFIPVGPNICFPRFITSEVEILQYYAHYFQETAQNGGNYTRIWLSAPVFEVEHDIAGKYDEALAQRMDKILALAKKYQIKVKFCLEHFRSITNSPAKFAGSVAFDRPVYKDQIKDMEAFFTSKEGKKLYLARVDFFAKRYANNADILGWELWNEIDAVPVKVPALRYDWTVAMLPEVQKRFPNHLVMQSMGSFDNEAKTPMYQQFMQISENALAQVHRYLDEGAASPVCQAPMDELASDAVRTLLNFNTNKPVLLSEAGAVEPNHAGPWKLYEKDTLGILLHDLLFAPFFAGAAGPGQSWHWDYYIEKNKLWWHFGRFKEAVKDFNPIQEKANPTFELHPNGLKIYGLQGKKTTLLWIRDATNNWKTELAEAQKVRIVQNIKVNNPYQNIKKVSFYDPWKNTWQTGERSSDGTIALPDFSRSLLVKLEK